MVVCLLLHRCCALNVLVPLYATLPTPLLLTVFVYIFNFVRGVHRQADKHAAQLTFLHTVVSTQGKKLAKQTLNSGTIVTNQYTKDVQALKEQVALQSKTIDAQAATIASHEAAHKTYEVRGHWIGGCCAVKFRALVFCVCRGGVCVHLFMPLIAELCVLN